MKDRIAPLVVIDIVGLTPDMIGESTPRLNDLINRGFIMTIDPLSVPAIGLKPLRYIIRI